MRSAVTQIREISLGTWLVIAGLVFSIAFQWRDFQTRAADQDKLAIKVEAISATLSKSVQLAEARVTAAESRLDRHEDRFNAVGERTRQLDDRITEAVKVMDGRYNAQAERITTLDRGASERERQVAQQYGEMLVRLARIECRLDPDCRSPPQQNGRR